MSELKTVERLDVPRYMGAWYEIARLPQSFENGLVGVTATYTLAHSGKVRVMNRGYVGSLNGGMKEARGMAKVADKRTNAKLKVTFFWPFYGNYWVLELGKEYEYAVVGEPSRRYLWILSRTPQMDEAVYRGILHRMGEKGFDISRMERVPQRSDAGQL